MEALGPGRPCHPPALPSLGGELGASPGPAVNGTTTALTSWCCWENGANAKSPRLVCAYHVRAPSPAVPVQPPSTQHGFGCTKCSDPLTPRPRISATEVMSGHLHASPCSDPCAPESAGAERVGAHVPVRLRPRDQEGGPEEGHWPVGTRLPCTCGSPSWGPLPAAITS